MLIGAQGGERILAEEVAGRLGTINYEVTCGLLRAGGPAARRVSDPLIAALADVPGMGWWAGPCATSCSAAR